MDDVLFLYYANGRKDMKVHFVSCILIPAQHIYTERIIIAIFLRREWLCRYIMLPAFYFSLNTKNKTLKHACKTF